MTPVLAWLTYSLVVGLLVGLAAWAGESALRAAGHPGRWAWVGGMVVSALIPLGALLSTMDWAQSVPVVAPSSVIPLVPLAVSVAPAEATWSLDALLLVVWAGLVVLGLVQIGRLNRVVERGHASGRRRRLNGLNVVVTRRLGPAVWGLRRPTILLPEWALTLDTRFRRLMLLHEGEHARAGDGRVVLAGLLVTALVPWNLALWWQLGRLRSAVELDCDERVLRRVRDPLNYGGLLLEVGRRRSGPVLGVALVERMPILERRLRRIIDAARRPPSMRKAIWLGVPAALLLTVAVLTRDPAPVHMHAMREVVVPPTIEITEGPSFTPFTVAPKLLNADEVAVALQAAYPPALRDAGIGGSVDTWLQVDVRGRVLQARVNHSSGYPALDEPAVRVAKIMRFSPAYNRDKLVTVWISMPIQFGSKSFTVNRITRERRDMDGAPTVVTVPTPPSAEAQRRELETPNFPSFTPFTVSPRLRNADAVSKALESAYPPLLRDAGISGEISVWFYIDEQGRVQRTRVNRRSGYPALDEAALKVAGMMEFTPAYNRDRPAAVWVSIPIRFSIR